MPQMLQDKHSGGRRQSPDLPEDLLHYASRPTGSPDSAANGISLHRARVPAQPTLHKGSDEGELSLSHVGAPTRGMHRNHQPQELRVLGPPLPPPPPPRPEAGSSATTHKTPSSTGAPGHLPQTPTPEPAFGYHRPHWVPGGGQT